MSRIDVISNRNVRIVATYVKSKLGSCRSLFEGLDFPSEEYPSPDDFFLNEDEWTTYENFERIFRRARELVDDPSFYFNCGASSARLRSWGRFHYFVRVFNTPNDGFKRLPFFNKNFNDTKEIEVLIPPAYDSRSKKMRTLLRVTNHSDVDPNRDYIRDPYLKGILSSIPTIWGLPPAQVKQLLYPYDPAVLFNEEPEFARYNLDVRLEGKALTLVHPVSGERCQVGEKVYLRPQTVGEKEVYLGEWTGESPGSEEAPAAEAILVTETVRNEDRIFLKEGEIFSAPYSILDVYYDRLAFLDRVSQLFRVDGRNGDPENELVDTIDRLRRSIKAKNEAYRILEKTNEELREAKARLDDYAGELERQVDERTEDLRKAQEALMALNRDLESKVNRQVVELERYKELRRYLSPKLTEQILSSGRQLGAQSRRKTMTVVFTDIRGFSAVTDSLEPEEIVHLLNRYFTEMTAIVHQHDGTLNKIMGDGLLIFFGDPIEMEDHARRAVEMAIAMQRRVRDMKEEWAEYGHDLSIGIGINTGFMTVGNLGSDAYRDYTVIGNQVNIASRLVAMAKPGQILLSQRTYSQVKGRVEAEELPEVKVKGIHSPVKTYSVQIF